MELELSLTTLHKRNSNEAQPQRNRVEGLNPRVEWRETRSSYFLNLIFQGLNKEDIHLELDNSRNLIIRGKRYLEDVGMVGWRWRLVEQRRPTSSRRARRPFTIPEDVNVGAVTARFHHAMLHVSMPKLSRTRFSPYHIYIHPSNHPDGTHPQRRHGEQHPHNAIILQSESAGDETMEHQTVLSRRVGEEDGVPIIMRVRMEEQNSVEVRVEECPPHEEFDTKIQEEMMQQPPANLSSSCLYDTLERMCSGHEGCSGIQTHEYSRPLLCEELSQLLASLGSMPACRLKR